MENPEARERYLTEARLQLDRNGFTTGEPMNGYLPVSWEDKLLCHVTGGGGVRFREADTNTEERKEALDRAVELSGTVLEYMRLMEAAPRLQAAELRGDFKLLAEFNRTVLAAQKYQNAPGHQFVTWERDYSGTGVVHGHYTQDYLSAKADFAERSGLVQKGRLFSDAQLTEIHRCMTEALYNDELMRPEREKLLRETAEQIEGAVPDFEQRQAVEAQKDAAYAEQQQPLSVMGMG